jgi:2-dehydro-3-deoxyphosphogluconate aldolase / (4S)-4-hydroxy-2-oxoglutarate aldolase
MACFDRLTVLNKMIEIGLVPIYYPGDSQTAKQIALACAKGGGRVVEFTNRGDMAVEVFKELSQHLAATDPGVILGAGSIQDAPTAALYISLGANFIVGPNLNPDVARLCNRRKVPYSPGCATATEIAQAEELGVEIVKLFPAESAGGPGFVKAMLGPSPWTRIMPTGGVEPTEESLAAWFKAGVACVGMGSNLITAELVKAGDFDVIAKKVAAVLALIRKVRGESAF